jgi:hypothetical protein
MEALDPPSFQQRASHARSSLCEHRADALAGQPLERRASVHPRRAGADLDHPDARLLEAGTPLRGRVGSAQDPGRRVGRGGDDPGLRRHGQAGVEDDANGRAPRLDVSPDRE